MAVDRLWTLLDIPPLPIRGTGSSTMSTFISTSWQHVCEEQLEMCLHPLGGVTFSFAGCFCCKYKLLHLFCI